MATSQTALSHLDSILNAIYDDHLFEALVLTGFKDEDFMNNEETAEGFRDYFKKKIAEWESNDLPTLKREAAIRQLDIKANANKASVVEAMGWYYLENFEKNITKARAVIESKPYKNKEDFAQEIREQSESECERRNQSSRAPPANLKQPDEFLNYPGTPSLPWKVWFRQFNFYMETSGYGSQPETQRIYLLRHCLGVEGNRVLDSLSEETYGFNDIVKLLDAHFNPAITPTNARVEFFNTLQRNDSIQEYIDRLCQVTADCEFGELEKDLQRDKFIHGLSNIGLKRALMAKPPQNWEETIRTAKQAEESNKIRWEEDRAPQRNQYKRPKLSDWVTMRRSEPRPLFDCHRCGTRHRKIRRECPAYGTICQKCNKRNHRTSCCDANQPRRGGSRDEQYSSDDDRMYRVENKASTSSHKTDSQRRGASIKEIKPKNTDTFVVIEGRQVDSIIDTGADMTLVNRKVANELGLASRISPSEIQLRTYTGQGLELVGTATVTMERSGTSIKTKIGIVDEGPTIIGSEDAERLKLIQFLNNYERTNSKRYFFNSKGKDQSNFNCSNEFETLNDYNKSNSKILKSKNINSADDYYPVSYIASNNNDSIKQNSKTTGVEANKPNHNRDDKNELPLVSETEKVYNIVCPSNDYDPEVIEYLPSIRGESFEIKLKDDAKPVLAKE
jgi:hypothetical protein